jgi:hypothetical protein
MNAYEQLRYDNIQKNNEFLESLSIKNHIFVAPLEKVSKKVRKVQVNGNIIRKSTRISENNNLEEKEIKVNDNKQLQDKNYLFSPPGLEFPRKRIDSTTLRQYILTHNSEHNDMITEMVTTNLLHYLSSFYYY